MKQLTILFTFLLLLNQISMAQKNEKSDNNSLKFGGYGSVDFSKELGNKNPASLDVHRLILTADYVFSSKTKFFGEIEWEHVKEVFVEQAWVQHKMNKFINFRAGLVLVPMGIINEFHENNTFNGVERPLIDKYVVPTTWREIGAGFTGTLINAQLSYQFYVINGFNGYDGSGHLNAQYPFRKGRQKGAESFMSSPNYSLRVEYLGLPGTKLGLSAYTGKSQTTLAGSAVQEIVDSSRVGIVMLGADARMNIKDLQLKAQYYFTSIGNTEQYNVFTNATDGNYLASNVWGFYTELAYNILALTNSDSRLDAFVRYEQFDTQAKMASNFTSNNSYKIADFTYGLTWKPTEKIAFKADMQTLKNKSANEWKHTVNLGIGFSL